MSSPGSTLARPFALLLVVVLAWPARASAVNDTPATAVPLSVTQSSVSDSLVGSTGGAYRYYQFSYQGGNAPVQVFLTFHPGYGSTGNQAFGFNLYGPSGLSFAGQPAGNNGDSSTAQYTLANGAAMTVLVQVYNYTAGMSVDYTLTVAGLSGGSAATLVGKTNTTPDQAANVTTINASIGGSITGSSAGAFQYYTLHYPGGDTPLSVTMNATPPYPGPGQALGFNLYRIGPGNVSGSPAATSSLTAADSTSATYSATLTGRSAADYQLQVFNYWSGVAVSYGIQVTGLAGPAPVVSGNTDAGHAVVLTSAQPGARGTLVGNGGGSFNYYLVAYPGNQSKLALSITYPSLGSASPSALGFNVYDGSNLVARINPSDDGTGIFSGEWGYQDANAKTFGIQVFNYAPGVSVSYVFYQVGAQ